MDAESWRGTARDAIDRFARHSPARLALGVFTLVILAFAGLLMLPWSTAAGQETALVDALFTATSAVSVTGLTTVPTATHWSSFGHVVIFFGMKIGGMGVMTLASILGMAVSRHLGVTQKILAASEVKTSRLGEVGNLLRIVLFTSTSIEIALAVILLPRFVALGESIGTAAWHALFYAVSAFNNAGFVLTPQGLEAHASDWLLLIPITVGVLLGSVGFPVLHNLASVWRAHRPLSRLSLHSKITLTMSLVLFAAGSLLFLATEWGNDGTIGKMDGPTKLLTAITMGIMPRSGGLATFDMGEAKETTWLLVDALMFVGGGSASTAGGIKVTTVFVLLLAILAEARGDRDMEAFGKRVPRDTLRLAVAVTLIDAAILLVSNLVVLEITGARLDVVLFETISAFGTCGLTTGFTATLPEPAKYVFVVLMFVGRTGTMTVAAALALRDRRRVIRMPEERPIVG